MKTKKKRVYNLSLGVDVGGALALSLEDKKARKRPESGGCATYSNNNVPCKLTNPINDNFLIKNSKTLNKQLMLFLKKKPKTLVEFTSSELNKVKATESNLDFNQNRDMQSLSNFDNTFQKSIATSVAQDNLIPNAASLRVYKHSVSEAMPSMIASNLNSETVNQNISIKNLVKEKTMLNKYIFNKFFICCKESRIESPTSFYGCFYIGPFDESLSQTLAHNIRRTLLSELSGLAITSVEIDGVSHKYSTISGVKETALDLICNLQNIVLKKELNQKNIKFSTHEELPKSITKKRTTTPDFLKPTALVFKQSLNKIASGAFQKMELIGYLRVRGPGVVLASDIQLPSGIVCVNPNQYIATLAEDGFLNMKIYIKEGKNYIKQTPKSLIQIKQNLSNTTQSGQSTATFNPTVAILKPTTRSATYRGADAQTNILAKKQYFSKRIYLDSVFMPVTKANAIVQINDKCTDDFLENNLDFKKVLPKKVRQNNLFDSTAAPLLSSYKVRAQGGLDNQIKESTQKQLLQKKATPSKKGKEEAQPTCKPAGFFSSFSISSFNILGSVADAQNASRTNSTSNNTNLDVEINLSSSANSQCHNTTFFKIQNSENPNVPVAGKSASLTQGCLESPLKVSNLFAEQNSQNCKPVLLFTEKSKIQQGNTRQCHIIVEIWTNGSLHPREALQKCLTFLTSTFISLESVKMLGSMYKSDLTYKKILYK